MVLVIKESGLFMDSDNIFEGLKENKKTLIVAFVLIVIMIIVSIFNLVLDNNSSDVDMKGIMQSFAEIYYEEYYYPEVKSTYGSDYLQQLQEDGIEGVKLTLREVINTFEDINTTKFYEEGNYRNFLDTYAMIYPKSHYDIDDYKIEVNVSCKKEISGD